MEPLLQYKVIQVIPDGQSWLDQVQFLLNDQAREGWELVTALQDPNAAPPHADPMVQSLSQVTSTLFVFKRPAS
jgi:hypothetical protein